MILAAAEPVIGPVVTIDEVQPLAVTVEIVRAHAEVDCRVLVSSGLTDKDEQACGLAKPKAEVVPRREVVGFRHVPGRSTLSEPGPPAGSARS
jgi:hypothetical protein